MSPAKLAVTGFVSIATFLTAPGTGRAQTCTSNADCGKGLSCQAGAATPTSPILCYDGDAGGACRPLDTPSTAATTCQAAACATDADCGTNMVCHGQTSTTCPTAPPATERCDPTTGCDPNALPVPAPAACTDTVTYKCAYKYELPCNTNAECGEGFTCQPAIYGTCTGSPPSSGEGTAGGGSASSGTGGAVGTEPAVPPVPPDVDAGAAPGTTCTTVSTYPGYCSARAIPCAVAADCPANWTCATVNTGTAIGGATAAPEGIDAGAPVPVAPPPETTTTSLCQPPSTRGTYGGTTRGSDQGTGTVAIGGDAGTGTGSNTPPNPTVPGTNVPTTEQTNAAATAGGGGCNIGGGLASDSAWLLGALAALGLLRARRRRA